MQRYRWIVLALVATGLFSGGVFCGMQWNGAESGSPVLTAEAPSGVSVLQTESRKPALPAPESNADPRPGGEAERAVQAGSGSSAAISPSPLAASEAPHARIPSGEAKPPAEGNAKPADKAKNETRAPAQASLETIRATNKLPFTASSSMFNLHKLGTGVGPTLLIIGGIQGDEPGGFSAASLIASHYTITSGSVWVVPDLNFSSILQRSRGSTGDMNRKFASISASDPDYDVVTQIKSVLLDEKINIILNLHDGSGFYRPAFEDNLRNPKRWGQSLIIDQAEIDAPEFSQLYLLASKVEAEVNNALLDPDHRYHIYNTYTSYGNAEMAKTLSYFAVCNGKPAFGIEASKEFTTEYRSYYHLQVIESFMRQMGISFTRDFKLTPGGVLAALNSNLKVAAYDNRLILDLENVRPALNMVPFKKGSEPDVKATKPLLAIVPDKKGDSWRVAYGNRTLTRLNPDFMDFDENLNSVEMVLDGKKHTVRLGEIISVKDSFLVKSQAGYRINAIGAQKEKNGSEADVLLVHKDFMPRFSVDKDAKTYRVEVYKGKAFAGMVLVRFGESMPVDEQPLTATNGPESEHGM